MNCTGQLDFCLLCYSNSCNDDGIFFFVLFGCICFSFYFYGKKSTLVARFYKNKSPTTRVEKLIILIFWIMDNLESFFFDFQKKKIKYIINY